MQSVVAQSRHACGQGWPQNEETLTQTGLIPGNWAVKDIQAERKIEARGVGGGGGGVGGGGMLGGEKRL